MPAKPISNATLHYTLIKHIIDHGFAPDLAELAVILAATVDDTRSALQRLADDHGVVLHPNSPKVWVIHPFSLAPTNFLVRSARREWWGNCAWCSLGVAALLAEDVTITTALGADDRQVTVHIRDGRVEADQYFVHFPVPMRQAWNNVIYTCSTMLLFEDEAHIDRWSQQHHIARGDVQPIANVWEFAKVWYGNHLNPEWTKWTGDEAQRIFHQFHLTGPTWQLPGSGERF